MPGFSKHRSGHYCPRILCGLPAPLLTSEGILTCGSTHGPATCGTASRVRPHAALLASRRPHSSGIASVFATRGTEPHLARVSATRLASYTYRVRCSTGPSSTVQGLPAWSTTCGTIRRFASVALRGEIAERLRPDCRFSLHKACV